MTTHLTTAQLDEVYTHLCRTMTELGEARSDIFLARLAMLALARAADAPAARRLVDDAATGLEADASAPPAD